ncbi:MAG: polyisoprenoid-binding protein [Rhodospirillales bacterium]|nr:MAG: polyisoprenoid-binding protein [Rhodospirillales bacterium]
MIERAMIRDVVRKLGRSVALAVVAVILATAASAAEWIVDVDESRIGFRATQMGAQFEGRFHRFSADVRFDPDDPGAGRAALTVEIASVDTGNAERDEAMQTAVWMGAAEHPAATFETDRIEGVGDGRYRAEGRLSLRGTSREVVFPFTFALRNGDGDSDVAVVTGEIPVSRTEFGIGRGEFAGDGVIGDRVVIGVELVATRP